MTAKSQLALTLQWHQGRDHAITGEALLAVLHRMDKNYTLELPDVRTLRDTIHSLRREGEVIASCTEGYFIPADAREAYDYIDEVLRSRAMDLLVTIRAQRRAVVTKYGRQIRMSL